MTALQPWDCCPEFIDIGDRKQSVRLLKRNDLFAVKGNISQLQTGEVELRLAGDDVSIVRGTPPSTASPDLELLPVYAAAKNSTPAVVTKRIFLRLEEHTPVDEVRDSIEALDFRIDDIPAYAPHCAWLEPKSGRVDDALSKLEMLRALPRVVNAEPQVLRPRDWKNRRPMSQRHSRVDSEN
jgi:hypothetical protein